MDFKNSVVLITGASSGIGYQLAKDLANEGAQLALLSRRTDLLVSLTEKLTSITKVKYYKCDVICNCGENRGVLFTTRSTVPEIKVEICSLCHPFFTGTQKIIDTAGRVEKFNKRYGKSKKAVDAKEATEKTETTEAKA